MIEVYRILIFTSVIAGCNMPARTVPDGEVPDLVIRDAGVQSDLTEVEDFAPSPKDMVDTRDLTPKPTCTEILETDAQESKQWRDWVPGAFDLDWNAATPNSPNPNIPDQVGSDKQLAAVVDVTQKKGPGCALVGLESISFDIVTDFYIGIPCEVYVDLLDGKGPQQLADCSAFLPKFPADKSGILAVSFLPLTADHMRFSFYLDTSRAGPSDKLKITPRTVFYLMAFNQREVHTRVLENKSAQLLVYK